MQVYTIGFTRKSAEQFFEALKQAGIRRVVDVRLHNVSQLAGFAKREDLAYFLRELCAAEYRHEPSLAPSEEIFTTWRGRAMSWDEFEARFNRLLADRAVESTIDPALFDVPTALLCSEDKPDHCHRRLVAEYLAGKWGGVEIVHL